MIKKIFGLTNSDRISDKNVICSCTGGTVKLVDDDFQFHGSEKHLPHVVKYLLEKNKRKSTNGIAKLMPTIFYVAVLFFVPLNTDLDLAEQVFRDIGDILSAQEAASYNPATKTIKQSHQKGKSGGKFQATGPPKQSNDAKPRKTT